MSRYASAAFLLFLFSSLITPVFGQDTRPIIVEQPDSPVSLSEYSASYQESGSYQREGVKHELSYQNASDRDIVAFELEFVMFSVFNEYMDTFGGVSMDDLEAGEDDDGGWVASSLNAFTFHTGVAFVRQLRYENGDIWEADMSIVEERLQKIQSGFDASQLEEDKDDSE